MSILMAMIVSMIFTVLVTFLALALVLVESALSPALALVSDFSSSHNKKISQRLATLNYRRHFAQASVGN